MLHDKERREACTTREDNIRCWITRRVRQDCLKRYLSLCGLALRDIR